MSLETKVRFAGVLAELTEIGREAGIPTKRTEALRAAVESLPLLVPVVGEFSAGKSSLLNLFMERNVLAVAITPETAVPAELYFSPEEYDEGVRADGSVERIADIATATGGYTCLRRHINSPALRDIQPLVLVDMPGFDSPLDAHNKAIFSYLDKGCHYIVLTPAEDGTISRSMANQIQNILDFSRSCTFFMSKTDMKSRDELDEIKREFQCGLEGLTGRLEPLYEVNKEDIAAFRSLAASLDAEKIFAEVFSPGITDACYDLKASLNTRIAALQTDQQRNQEAVRELERALKKIEDKKQRMLEDAEYDDFRHEADTIADEVGRALNGRLESLVQLGMSAGVEELEAEMNNIVQRAVVSRIHTVVDSVSTRLSSAFSQDFTGLSDLFSRYNFSDSIARMQDSLKTMYDSGVGAIGRYIDGKKEGAATRAGTTALTALAGIFSVATTIVAPIVEAFLILLPSILKGIGDFIQKRRQQEQLREAIQTKIPVIKGQVRAKLEEVLRERKAEMVASIAERYDQELRQKAEEIQRVVESHGDPEEAQRQIASLQQQVERVNGLLVQMLKGGIA